MTFPVSWIDPARAVKPPKPRFADLIDGLANIKVEEKGWETCMDLITHRGLGKARIFFIGNGGSAAIASHMKTDWEKNGGFATFGPGDSPYMTCVSNDMGFNNVYALQLERHGLFGDVVFAISSSGMSENILHAVDVAKDKMMNLITLSGFGEGNFLRTKGQVNFYVPSSSYGVVEISHLAILHSILDEIIANDQKS